MGDNDLRKQARQAEAQAAAIRRGQQQSASVNLQSAQPERKKGIWIYIPEEQKFMCSRCRARIDKDEKFRSFYCYHCGSDNKEGDHNATN